LYNACGKGNLSIVKYLVDNGVPIYDKIINVILRNSRRWKMENDYVLQLIKYFVEKGVIVHEREWAIMSMGRGSWVEELQKLENLVNNGVKFGGR